MKAKPDCFLFVLYILRNVAQGSSAVFASISFIPSVYVIYLVSDHIDFSLLSIVGLRGGGVAGRVKG